MLMVAVEVFEVDPLVTSDVVSAAGLDVPAEATLVLPPEAPDLTAADAPPRAALNSAFACSFSAVIMLIQDEE